MDFWGRGLDWNVAIGPSLFIDLQKIFDEALIRINHVECISMRLKYKYDEVLIRLLRY